MKSVIILAILCVAVTARTPTRRPESHVTITKEIIQLFPPIYTGQHDIVDISFPINLHFRQLFNGKFKLLFIEGDIQDNGNVTNSVLYFLKDDNTKKLLDNAQCVVSEIAENGTSFIGAKDGIYKFNPDKEEVEKFGTLTEDVISITKQSNSDTLYVVNDKHELYKVTEGGTKKENIGIVKDAKQAIIDLQDNLYILFLNKKVQVLKDGKLQDVTGLPENAKNIKIYQTIVKKETISILVVADTENYMIESENPDNNGPTAKRMEYNFGMELTALAPEAPSLKFLGFEKKIYDVNIATLSFNVIGRLAYLKKKTNK